MKLDEKTSGEKLNHVDSGINPDDIDTLHVEPGESILAALARENSARAIEKLHEDKNSNLNRARSPDGLSRSPGTSTLKRSSASVLPSFNKQQSGDDSAVSSTTDSDARTDSPGPPKQGPNGTR